MQVSLLSLRLQLAQCVLGPASEPILRVGRTCVAALWECGCASVGTDFEAMTFIPCWLHNQLEFAEAPSAPPLPPLPPRALVARELRANSFPTAPRPTIEKQA